MHVDFSGFVWARGRGRIERGEWFGFGSGLRKSVWKMGQKVRERERVRWVVRNTKILRVESCGGN